MLQNQATCQEMGIEGSSQEARTFQRRPGCPMARDSKRRTNGKEYKQKFSVNPSKRAFWLKIYRESPRVACRVDCVLRVCCMWVAWQGHATQPSCFQSLAPATQKSSIDPKVLRLPHEYTRQLAKLVCCVALCHATHMQHTRNTQSTRHATRALFL